MVDNELRGLRRSQVLIAGLGNELMMDDGLGIHAVRALSEKRPRGVRLLEVGTAILDALPFLERVDRVLAIDAMQAGGDPGTIYICGIGDINNAGVRTSMHEMGLRQALYLIPEDKRPEIRVIGVEPERIEYHMALTNTVAASLPRLLKEVRYMVSHWDTDERFKK